MPSRADVGTQALLVSGSLGSCDRRRMSSRRPGRSAISPRPASRRGLERRLNRPGLVNTRVVLRPTMELPDVSLVNGHKSRAVDAATAPRRKRRRSARGERVPRP